MAILKKVLFAVGGLAVVGAGGFFALGQMSQSGSAPGLVDGRLTPCPESPNCVSSEEGTDPEKSVEVLPTGAWGQLPDVIASLGGEVTEASEGYIAAEFKSSTFGFVDDVEFRLAEDGVHVRSASRVGYSDAGVNAQRVGDIRNAVE